MKPKGIKYLVSYHPAIYDLPADTAGTLDVVNMLSGNVFWFDNENAEWHKSIYSAKSTLEALGTEYEEVEHFDNGYINTDELWDDGWKNSLTRRYPEEFKKNLEQTPSKEESVDVPTLEK